MKNDELKFNIYLTVLRFIPFKITCNLRRLYIDVSIESKEVVLTGCYNKIPSELELELLDDITTNTIAHTPNFFVKNITTIVDQIYEDERHDFIAFAFYE